MKKPSELDVWMAFHFWLPFANRFPRTFRLIVRLYEALSGDNT